MKHLFILILSALSISFYGQTKAVDYKNKAVSKYELKDYQGAIQDFNKAIELNPKYVEAYLNRGLAKKKLKDYTGSIEDYTKAIGFSPIDANAYYCRGIAKDSLGDKDGACSDYNKAIRLGIKVFNRLDCNTNTQTKVSTTAKTDKNNDILAKVLYGAKKDLPLTNNKVYLTGTKGDTIKTTQTNEYGDFEFRKVSTENVNIVVGMSDKIKNEKEIYLAKQNGTIISTIKKTANGFTYRILPADIKNLSPIKEEDTDMKIDAFSKSTDKTITVAENIYYPTNEYKITSDVAKKLDVIVNSLTKNITYQLEIYSHTDANGDDAANLELSNKRANAVLDYLVSKGIEKNRLTAKGMGETKIINRCANDVNCSEKEHELNRRTEFKFIK